MNIIIERGRQTKKWKLRLFFFNNVKLIIWPIHASLLYAAAWLLNIPNEFTESREAGDGHWTVNYTGTHSFKIIFCHLLS